ncbi:NUDIX hydrolase [Streptomyces sp. RPA4-5]|uniref:NUDIX domain-containing protein n=1 Tax=Streptomyces TaxID=1883 RepID=UPI00143E8881|nr:MULTISPECIES: NUDIX hydrolase [Streptomyces]MCX4636263.1 NUDIX hydrolase [Streptomyces platensis]QIY57525.1 NUDIX hydrolase [Streptomyces sp. RPA4-5]WJY40619.1 NUDIX hydrolase [Streptomyces sp. P9-2B-2]
MHAGGPPELPACAGLLGAVRRLGKAAVRELKEELGLTVTLRGFLVVDWVAPHEAWDDQLAFVFDGGVLEHEVAGGLRPHDEELSRLAFVSKAEALTMLPQRMAPRFVAATEALTRGIPHYLHNGSALP